MKISKITCLLFSMLLLFFAHIQAQTYREFVALVEIYQNTRGHGWTHTWDLTTPIAQWHGVTVKDGKVIALDLSDNNLQGKIPLTIVNLRNLQQLDLSNNQLKGKLPGELRKFDALERIDLSNNQLTGKIPKTINRLENLKQFDLTSNRLEGELPKTIIELTKLNSLAIADNRLQGEIPEGMEKLTKLQKLYIGNNGFTGLENLKALSVQQLVLTDVDVKADRYNEINFLGTKKEGLSKLNFEDDNDDQED
ncbi:MAG: Two component regulator three Y domain protein [Bacteroidota bacterium]